jgi:hypothetical protein
MSAIADPVEAGKLRALIEASFRPGQAAKGHEPGDTGHVTGKVVLTWRSGVAGLCLGRSGRRTSRRLISSCVKAKRERSGLRPPAQAARRACRRAADEAAAV